MNNSDALRIETVLNGLRYEKTGKEKDADLIVAVACSVRQSAIDRIYGKVRNWQKEKNKRKLVTVLTGCVLPADKKKFSKVFDLVFNIENLPLLSKMLNNLEEANVKERGEYLKLKSMHSSGFQSLVPIMTGCNNFCAYCAVPFTRGREYSRPIEDIISEVKELVENGCKEITLLGQNVNSYGNDKKDLPNFAELLSKINDVPGDFWIRYITSHPKDMSDELIKKFVQCSKVCGYLHLPLQAGSDQVLKNMNRNYTYEHYKDLIEKVRAEKLDIAISTDIIVGFPGETIEQFEDSMKAFGEIKYDMAYIAQYSPRSGTKAATFDDNVDKKEKKRRLKVLTKILAGTALEKNKKYVGKTEKVLAEKFEKGLLFGHTDSFKLVAISGGSKNYVGQVVMVKIISANPWALEGKCL